MRCSKSIASVLLAFITQFLILQSVNTSYFNDIFKNDKVEQSAQLGWVFDGKSLVERSKRSPFQSRDVNIPQEKVQNPFNDPVCRNDLRRLCGSIDKHNDDLLLLECVQTFKVCIYKLKKIHLIFSYLNLLLLSIGEPNLNLGSRIVS